MQDGRFPKLEKQRGSEVVIPKRDGKTSSWKRVEEYRINKPSQQFKKNKNFISYVLFKNL
jgi:hypothetical protein